jgi:hypothetical protein
MGLDERDACLLQPPPVLAASRRPRGQQGDVGRVGPQEQASPAAPGVWPITAIRRSMTS